ncbi:MAG: hypothetical protein LPH21_09700 [Shewanella sp.]|nr:hypothetical protein [Shewanella sp.]
MTDIYKNANTHLLREVAGGIADFRASNKGREVYVHKCQCGALTMSVIENHESAVFMHENAPYIQPTNDVEMCNCNHCVNNDGLDIEYEEDFED